MAAARRKNGARAGGTGTPLRYPHVLGIRCSADHLEALDAHCRQNGMRRGEVFEPMLDDLVKQHKEAGQQTS